jgi:hypothetical protein
MAELPKSTAEHELPKWATLAPLALLAVGTTFYFVIAVGLPDERKAFWGQAGDSVAPFAVLFNAVALLAVVYSMKLQLDSLGEQRRALALQRKELRLQRQELALQREELAANREVMKEQAEQFERTAKAQEALARSQFRLANQQESTNRIAHEANRIAMRRTRAQIGTTLSTLVASRASLRTMAAGSAYNPLIEHVRSEIEELDRRIEAETISAHRLSWKLGEVEHADEELADGRESAEDEQDD